MAARSFFSRLRRRAGRHWSTPAYQLKVGGHWNDVGRMQFDFLQGEGLRSEHYLLDVACGSFRAGRFLIDYLEAGHYAGFDADPELLEAGRQKVLAPQGLLEKQPHIVQIVIGVDDFDLRAILKREFDYVWAHALFDHIPHDSIRACLHAVSGVLAPGGRLYATIFLNPHGHDFREPMVRPRYGSLKHAVVTYPDREYWHHTLDFFREATREIPALELDACLYNYPHPLGLRVLRFLRV